MANQTPANINYGLLEKHVHDIASNYYTALKNDSRLNHLPDNLVKELQNHGQRDLENALFSKLYAFDGTGTNLQASMQSAVAEALRNNSQFWGNRFLFGQLSSTFEATKFQEELDNITRAALGAIPLAPQLDAGKSKQDFTERLEVFEELGKHNQSQELKDSSAIDAATKDPKILVYRDSFIALRDVPPHLFKDYLIKKGIKFTPELESLVFEHERFIAKKQQELVNLDIENKVSISSPTGKGAVGIQDNRDKVFEQVDILSEQTFKLREEAKTKGVSKEDIEKINPVSHRLNQYNRLSVDKVKEIGYSPSPYDYRQPHGKIPKNLKDITNRLTSAQYSYDQAMDSYEKAPNYEMFKSFYRAIEEIKKQESLITNSRFESMGVIRQFYYAPSHAIRKWGAEQVLKHGLLKEAGSRFNPIVSLGLALMSGDNPIKLATDVVKYAIMQVMLPFMLKILALLSFLGVMAFLLKSIKAVIGAIIGAIIGGLLTAGSPIGIGLGAMLGALIGGNIGGILSLVTSLLSSVASALSSVLLSIQFGIVAAALIAMPLIGPVIAGTVIVGTVVGSLVNHDVVSSFIYNLIGSDKEVTGIRSDKACWVVGPGSAWVPQGDCGEGEIYYSHCNCISRDSEGVCTTRGSSSYAPSIDIGAGCGTPIYAYADGVVIHNSYLPDSYGYNIIINHPTLGYTTRYGHFLAASSLSVGSSVTKGQLVGYMGSTGFSDMCHLHLEFGGGASGSVHQYVPEYTIKGNISGATCF